MAIATEKTLERKLREQVNRLGGIALKFTSPGFTGVPDRLVLMGAGRSYFVELKSPGKSLEPRQVFVKKQFEKIMHRVWIIDSEKSLSEFINKISDDQI